MSAPLSEQQLAEIAARVEGVRAMKFTTGLNAASGYFDTPVERELYMLAATCWNALQSQLKDSDALLAEATRLRAEFSNAVATVARLEQKRVELEKIANAERARVAELEAERHSTNEALDDVVKALAEKNERIAELEAAAPRVVRVPPASFVLKAMANVPDSLPRCPVCTFAPAYCTCFGKTHRFDPERLGVSDAKRRLANCVGCGQPRNASVHTEEVEPR